MQWGGSPEVSSLSAFKEVTAAYQPSEVNGVKEIMRNSPEAVYNLSSEQIRTDLNNQLTRDFGVENPGDFIIRPHSQTQFQKRPTYQVYSVDEHGMLQPERDQNHQYVRYTPDLESIKNKTNEAALSQAKKEREKFQKFQESQRPLSSIKEEPSESGSESTLKDMGME
jgi:hypothetical protein